MSNDEKLRSLYTKRDEINKRIHEIQHEDNNYIHNSYHYKYDSVYGEEWIKLHHQLLVIQDNITMLEHNLGIGLFMTDKGLAIVTLKDN